MIIGECPECDAAVAFPHPPKLSENVLCDRCHAALTVIGIAPLELDWAFTEPLDLPGPWKAFNLENFGKHKSP
jgi:lysine biosynthesis protein LysW